MKYFIITILFFSFLFSREYYAKLEPIQSFKIKSSVRGKVVFSNKDLEGKVANKSLVVNIDSKIDKIDLSQSRKKLKYIDDMIKIEKNNYARLSKVSSKSAYEKDIQKLKYINLLSTKSDLVYKIENLKDIIKNKTFIEQSNYISKIAVNKGDYVNAGSLLYEAQDLTKAKLEFFIPISDIKEIKNRSIYLDGKKSDVKIDTIYKVADSRNISSYKVKIVLENQKKFSRLVKIEFK